MVVDTAKTSEPMSPSSERSRNMSHHLNPGRLRSICGTYLEPNCGHRIRNFRACGGLLPEPQARSVFVRARHATRRTHAHDHGGFERRTACRRYRIHRPQRPNISKFNQTAGRTWRAARRFRHVVCGELPQVGLRIFEPRADGYFRAEAKYVEAAAIPPVWRDTKVQCGSDRDFRSARMRTD